MFHGDSNVITCPAIIAWDGITRPEANDAGTLVHSLRVAMAATAPEVAELEQLCNKALAEGEFKGVMPPGGHWPISDCDPVKFEGRLAGMKKINPKTYRGTPPQVFDTNGQELQPMAYGPMLYPGATVKLLVHAASYNNKQKGVGLYLDGIMIVDATTPRLPLGGVDAAAAFGGAAAPVTPAPVTPAPVTPAPVTPPPAAFGGAAAPVTPAPVTPAPVTPPPAAAPDFLNPPPGAGGIPAAHTMTALAAGATYEQFIAQGWKDNDLIAKGYMLN